MKYAGEPELGSEQGRDVPSYITAERSFAPLVGSGGYISQDAFVCKSQESNSKGFKYGRKYVLFQST